MTRVLITAFGPDGEWPENASWLALQALTRETPPHVDLTTRLYPADLEETRRRLESDMADGYDTALHLAQAAGSGWISFEAFGVNSVQPHDQPAENPAPLAADGPPACRSTLPLGAWAEGLRGAGVPARVSVQAGASLGNATLYFSHYFAQQHNAATGSTLVHLPLDPSQVVASGKDLASMPAETVAAALRGILETLPARALA